MDEWAAFSSSTQQQEISRSLWRFVLQLKIDDLSPGSIPGTTRFSGGGKKNSSGSGTGSTQPREYN
jgi:hypothetical protein